MRVFRMMGLALMIAAVCAGGAMASQVDASGTEALLTDLYVSLSGAEGGAGSIDDPLPSLDAARLRLRQIPGDHTVTVWIQGGVYNVGQTIEFTDADRSNVIYRALPGQSPVMDAGLPVAGFSETTIDGVTVWAALVPQLLQNNDDPVLALYDDKGALPLNRYPKTDYLEADRFELNDAVSALRYGSEGELSNVNSFRAFFAGKDLTDSGVNPAAFADPQNVLVRILHLWKDETAYLRGYDPQTGRIALSRATSLTVWQGDQYYFENMREGLSLPGSWYLDRNAGVLFVVPKPGWDISALTLRAGVSDRVMTLSGLDNVTFSGLTFTHTGWSVPDEADFPQAAYDVEAAVFARNCSYLSFEGCVFRDLGGTALKLYQGVRDSRVAGCLFERVGANGVFVHGVNMRSDPRRDERIEITDNEIHDYGVNYRNAVGVLLVHAADCVISHNTIHDGAYTAISVGWVWGGGYNATQGAIVSDNLIYNIGSGSLSDMGGIYLLGRQPGTVVVGNVIHDVRYAENDGYGGWGIYLDEGSAEIIVLQNLVYNCASQGLFVHKGIGNMVISNIFANNKRGQVAASKQREDEEPEVAAALQWNILYGGGKTMFADTPVGRILQSGANVYWDPNADERLRTLLGEFGFADDAVVRNPRLADPARNVFTPTEDSPAYDVGFMPYDWSGAGVR